MVSLKDSLATYINNNGGTPWRAFLSVVRTSVASDFIRKIAGTFATRIALIIVGMITGVLIARILGPEGRGLYAVAMTMAATGIQFANMGLHASNTYYVAKDRSLLPALVGNTFSVSFALGIVIILVASSTFFIRPDWAPVHGILLATALAWIPFGVAYMLLQNILLGIHEVRAFNTIELTMQIAGVALLGALVLFNAITVELVFLMGLATVVGSTAWAFGRIRPHLRGGLTISLQLFKNNMQYGVKAYLAAFFAFLVLRADMFMVKYMLNAEQAGYYSIAVNMADMIYMLPTVIATILFPKLSSMPVKAEKWMFSKKVILVSALALSLIAGVAVLCAGTFVRLLFGAVYEPAVPAFIWLMPGILFLGIQAIAVQFLNSEGFPKSVVLIWIAAFLINIGLNLYTIPHFGIKGASLASSLSYLFVLLPVSVLIGRSVHDKQ